MNKVTIFVGWPKLGMISSNSRALCLRIRGMRVVRMYCLSSLVFPQNLKKMLSVALVLQPLDWSLPFHVFVDASDVAIGAVLI